MDERLRHKLVLAKEHFDRREFDHAEPLLLQVLEKEPGLADVQNLLGIVRHERGEFGLARDAFETAVRLNPKYTEALLNLVVTCNDLGDYDAGKRIYDQVRGGGGGTDGEPGKDPYALGKIANMHADVAEAYAHAGYATEAVAELEKASALRPGFADLRVRLGCLRRDLGDLSATEHAFRAAITEKPSYAAAHVQLGITHYMAGAIDAAAGAFEEALQWNPTDKIATMYLRLVRDRR